MTVRFLLSIAAVAIVLSGSGLLYRSVESRVFSIADAREHSADDNNYVEKAASGFGLWDEDASVRFKSIDLRTTWKNRGGDWIDAEGVPQGSRPFTTISIPDRDAMQSVELDVTGYVRKFGGDLALRALRGTLTFYSRESGQGPVLVLDGQNHSPIADTTINTTTVRALGKGQRLGSQSLILIRFDVRPGDYKSAILRLNTTDKQYGNIVLGLFQPDNTGPRLIQHRAETAPLAERDDILLQVTGAEDWAKFQRGSRHIKPVDIEGGTLHGLLPKGTAQGTLLNLVYKFADHGIDPPDHAFFRYRLKIKNWSTTMGGKLPGLAGTYGRAGWGGRIDRTGTEGWSSRGYMDKSSAEHKVLPIGQYIYHMDSKGWGDVSRTRLPIMENRWVWIEQEVRLNEPGKSDGLVRTWLDGYLMQERENLRFRSIDSIHIDRLWLNIYFGGTGYVADNDHEYWVSDIVVARSYIGPGKS